MPSSTHIDTIIDTIFQAAELDDLPEGVLQKYKEDLKVELQKHLGIKIMEQLRGDTLKAYVDFTGDNPNAMPEQIMEFLSGKVPHLDQIIADAAREFAMRFVENVKRLQAAIP